MYKKSTYEERKAKRVAKISNKRDKATNWPLRTCRTLQHCFFCEKDIILGEKYYDGGYPWRIHQKCAE